MSLEIIVENRINRSFSLSFDCAPLFLVGMDAACDWCMPGEAFRSAQVICSVKASADSAICSALLTSSLAPAMPPACRIPLTFTHAGVGELLCFSLLRIEGGVAEESVGHSSASKTSWVAMV